MMRWLSWGSNALDLNFVFIFAVSDDCLMAILLLVASLCSSLCLCVLNISFYFMPFSFLCFHLTNGIHKFGYIKWDA